MRILILGTSGYLGRALKRYLEERGHKVSGIDNNSREENVRSVHSDSLTPLPKQEGAHSMSTLEFGRLKELFKELKPDAIVHLAEQPSAPFSMISADHAAYTQHNNIAGTLNVLWAIKEACPNTHLIKLGTAGEYPDWLYKGIQVPEGSRITVQYQGRDWEIPTPRYAGSWYHFSKVHDSLNIDYACKLWKLRATDLNQGVVYGHIEGTRFDYDEYFGTVVNRFAVQATAGLPLTIYGTGGQSRGFININNTMQAIELVAKNLPKEGEFRVFHQLTETQNVRNIANMVQKITGIAVDYLDNPRVEMAKSEFKFEARGLRELGLKPIPMMQELPNMISFAEKYRERINKDVIQPKTKWR